MFHFRKQETQTFSCWQNHKLPRDFQGIKTKVERNTEINKLIFYYNYHLKLRNEKVYRWTFSIPDYLQMGNLKTSVWVTVKVHSVLRFFKEISFSCRSKILNRISCSGSSLHVVNNSGLFVLKENFSETWKVSKNVSQKSVLV